MTLRPAAPADNVPGEPAWLHAHRRAAGEALADLSTPTVDDEVWRYSPIGSLDLSRYTVVPVEIGTAPAGLPLDGAAARIQLTDGIVTGLAVGDPAVTVLSGRNDPAGTHAASLAGEQPGEYVALLAHALSPDPLSITVAPGAVVAGPIVIEHHVGTGRLVATRVSVHLGADAEATVVERRRADAALVVPLLDLDVADAARLHHVDLQLLDDRSWQLGQQSARVGAQATLSMHQAGLGGAYARMRTDCALVGRGASGNLAAVSFGRNQQILDFRTFQEHAAPDTTSDLLFKGAVDDDARSVYSGLIRVRPEGRGTVAQQTNRNIKLSETAWAESVPNLEIETNDVRCSHASTVGPIDEDQRFYLESRGVPPDEAERLILAGFFDEVLARIPVPEVALELGALIGRELEAVHA